LNVTPEKKKHWHNYHQLYFGDKNDSSINDSDISAPSPIIEINNSDLYESDFQLAQSLKNNQRTHIDNLTSQKSISLDLNKSFDKLVSCWSPFKFIFGNIVCFFGLDYLIIPFYVKIFLDFLKFITILRNFNYEKLKIFFHGIYFFIIKLIIYTSYTLIICFILIIFKFFCSILSFIY
jgi:hypothetical protein